MNEISLEAVQKKLGQIEQKHLGGTILLFGEAGIGKSYTATKILATLRCSHLTIKANENLETIFAKLPKKKKNIQLLNETLENLIKNCGVNPEPLVGAMTLCLKTIAPFVLCVEDLHEADSQRLNFWKELAERTKKIHGLGLLLTSRQLQLESIAFYKLPALNDEQIQLLLLTQSKTALPHDAILFIHQRACGNPLFSLEYFRYLARLGVLWFDSERWRWRQINPIELPKMPIGVEALITDSLKRLTANEQKILAVYAVLGQCVIENDILIKVLEQSPSLIDAGIETLTRHGIIFNHRIIHPLFREVALQSLTTALRHLIIHGLLRVFQNSPLQTYHLFDDPTLSPLEVQNLIQNALDYATKTGRHDLRGLFLAKQTRYLHGLELANIAYEAADLLEYEDLRLAFQMIETACGITEVNYLHVHRWVSMIRAWQGQDALKNWYEVNEKKYAAYLGESWKYVQIAYALGTNDVLQVIAIWENTDRDLKQIASPVFNNILRSYGRDLQQDMVRNLITKRLKILPKLHKDRLFLLVATLNDRKAPNYETEKIKNKNSVLEILRHYEKNKLFISKIETINTKCWFFHNKVLEIDGLLIEKIDECRELLTELLKLNLVEHYRAMLTVYVSLLSDSGDLETKNTIFSTFVEEISQDKDLYFLFVAEYVNFMPYEKDKFLHSPHFFLYELRKYGEQYRYRVSKFAREILPNLAFMELYFGDINKAKKIVEELQQNYKDSDFLVFKSKVIEFFIYFNKSKSEAKKILLELMDLFTKMEIKNTKIEIFIKICEAIYENSSKKADIILSELQKNNYLGYASIIYHYMPNLNRNKNNSITIHEEKAVAFGQYKVNIFGDFQIFVNGKSQAFSSTLGKKLFISLIEARMQGKFGRDKLYLCELLFPNQDGVAAINSLYVLIYRMRVQFGEQIIFSQAENYVLGAVETDIEQFFASGQLELCTGVYAEDFDTELRDEVLELLKFHVQENLMTQPKQAARVAKILVQMEPYDRDLLRLALETQKISKTRPERIKTYYQNAKNRFSELGEFLPNLWEEFILSTTNTKNH